VFQIAGFEPCNRSWWRPIFRYLRNRRRSQLAQSTIRDEGKVDGDPRVACGRSFLHGDAHQIAPLGVEPDRRRGIELQDRSTRGIMGEGGQRCRVCRHVKRTEREHDDDQALDHADPPNKNHPVPFDHLASLTGLVPYFKPITTGVCARRAGASLSPNS